jgi:hypothetical protein
MFDKENELMKERLELSEKEKKYMKQTLKEYEDYLHNIVNNYIA